MITKRKLIELMADMDDDAPVLVHTSYNDFEIYKVKEHPTHILIITGKVNNQKYSVNPTDLGNDAA